MSKLVTLSLLFILLFGCKIRTSDKYMCGFVLGGTQDEWSNNRSQLIENRNSGFFSVYSYESDISKPLMGKASIGADSAFAWLSFNDDTISKGTLRRLKMDFTEKITDDVFKYLCSVYGNPVSHSFELGNSVLKGHSISSNGISFKDTAFHIWSWKTPSMIIEHRFNVFPPDSNSPDSYIEYRLLNDSVVREINRSEIVRDLKAYEAVDLVLMLKLPWDISPTGVKNWSYDPTIKVLCTGINNNDVAKDRSIIKITGNARFYVPMEDAEIEFKDISITPIVPVGYKRKAFFDPPLTAFKGDSLNTLREHYQHVIKRMQELGKKIEYTFSVTQVQYSDGTILKDQ